MSREEPRTPEQIEHDRTFIARGLVAGKSHPTITRELIAETGRPLSRSTVTRDAQMIRREWRQERLRHVDDLVAQELAVLADLERRYREGFERSMEDRTERTAAVVDVELAADADGVRIPAQRRTTSLRTIEGRGDPHWLNGILACRDRRIKLLGLDQPAVIGVHDTRTGPYERPEVSSEDVEAARVVLHELMQGGKAVTPIGSPIDRPFASFPGQSL
jgi:hypothetical protein